MILLQFLVAALRLRLGGKTSAASGDPVDLTARVQRIASGLGQHLGQAIEPLGTVVWLRVGKDFDTLVNDLRVQVYHPEAFEQMGIRLQDKALVTVKSLFHYYASFKEIASEVWPVATPGGTSPDFAASKLTRSQRPFWPAVEDPFAARIAPEPVS